MFLKLLYHTILDALFPVTKAELEVLNMSPREALTTLPIAPPPPITNVQSIFAYKDPRVTQLVWHVKYKKSSPAVAIAGLALYENLVKQVEKYSGHNPPIDSLLVIPMPITERRRKERGYNQCELLTAEIGRLDHSGKLKIRTDILARTHHSSRQTLKSRADRLESAKGIFSVQAGIEPELFSVPVIVIDDVITTGSTINEAMETLRVAGFTNVSGLSVAH